MTNEQMTWAEQHDWCVGRTNGNTVVTRESMHDERNTVEYRNWDDYAAMREWAGY